MEDVLRKFCAVSQSGFCRVAKYVYAASSALPVGPVSSAVAKYVYAPSSATSVEPVVSSFAGNPGYSATASASCVSCCFRSLPGWPDCFRALSVSPVFDADTYIDPRWSADFFLLPVIAAVASTSAGSRPARASAVFKDSTINLCGSDSCLSKKCPPSALAERHRQ